MKECIDLLFNIIFKILGQIGFQYVVIGFFLILSVFWVVDKICKSK